MEVRIKVRCEDALRRKFKSLCARYDWTYADGIKALMYIARKNPEVLEEVPDDLSIGDLETDFR